MEEMKDFDFAESLEQRLNETMEDEVNFFDAKSKEKLDEASKKLPDWSLEPPFSI